MKEVLIIACCLALNALLAAFEMAFVTMAPAELKRLAGSGNRRAKHLLRMRSNPERTLSIIQVGITVVGAMAAATGGVSATQSLEPYLVEVWGFHEIGAELFAILGAVLPITFLSVVVGELVPKALALRNPSSIALRGALAVAWADRFLGPIISVLEWSTKFLLRPFSRYQPEDIPEAETTGDEVIAVNKLSPLHRRFMFNLVDIERKKIEDIYTPWEKVSHVADSDSLERVAQVAMSSGHTRLPVTSEGKVTGILHTKEFAVFRETGESSWQALIRPAIRIRSTDANLGVLRLLQSQRNHMAIVYSPGGKRLGIVTLEDILEQVVGDIYDEDDDGFVYRMLAARRKRRPLSKRV